MSGKEDMITRECNALQRSFDETTRAVVWPNQVLRLEALVVFTINNWGRGELMRS